jgi:hypothetical protein
MFKGFNIKYPEYEVITPQTKRSYHVRSLSVQEEEKLKASLLTPSKINEHLNKCLYDSITVKPEDIIDYDTWLKQTSLKDRDALLYGLYHITYDEIRNYDVNCGNCAKEYPVTVKASSTFNYEEFPGDDVLNKKFEVKLPVSKGVSVYLKQPTLFDEIIAIKTLAISTKSNLDIITETLVIDRFEDLTVPDKPSVYSDREDVRDAYLSLPAGDKREIYKHYREQFGKYGVTLLMRSNCIHCGFEEEVNLDLVSSFFRMVHSV